MKEHKHYLIPASVCAALGLFFLLALSGYDTLAYCFFGAALVILAYMVLNVLCKKKEKLARILYKILTYGLILFLLAISVTIAALLGEARTAGGDSEYVIVLGAGVNGTEPSRSLLARLNTALTYAEENKSCVFILTGGNGAGETVTEAECMRDWLVERGVDDSRLIMETEATNTLENIKYSREAIREFDPEWDGSVLIISEGYHLMRAKLMALDNGYVNVSSMAAHTGMPILTANYYIREAIALWYYMMIR